MTASRGGGGRTEPAPPLIDRREAGLVLPRARGPGAAMPKRTSRCRPGRLVRFNTPFRRSITTDMRATICPHDRSVRLVTLWNAPTRR